MERISYILMIKKGEEHIGFHFLLTERNDSGMDIFPKKY